MTSSRRDIKVSAIIPVKNREDELIRAVESVLGQTHDNWELLVVDDKSEIDIKGILERFADARIQYILNDKERSNANVSRNLGLDLAEGDYVAFLDSDDEWKPNHLSDRLSLMEVMECDGLFGSFLEYNGEQYHEEVSRNFRKGEKMINYILSDGRAQTSSYFLKSGPAKQIRWDEELVRHQDYDFSVRFAEKFAFKPCRVISVIVHWTKGQRRLEHFESQIKFVEKYRKDISPEIFNHYCQQVFAIIKRRNDLSKEVYKYFEKNRFANIHEVSLSEFLYHQKAETSRLSRLYLRIVYVLKVIFNR